MSTTNGYTDKTLVCADCRAEFTWTAGEQEFYARQGLRHEPKRCAPCRKKKRGTNSRPDSSRQR